MYAQQNNDFIRNCLYNKEIYLNDKNSPIKDGYIEDYPSGLYFLPDGIKNDNLSRHEIESFWADFINELTKITIFENNFNFLIFICQGHNYFNDFIMREIAYQKFITINMLPGSIVNCIDEHKKGKGKVHLVGEKNIPYISNQLADLLEASFLYFPDCFSEDLLEFVYLKKKNRISQETKKFIKQIMERVGIKNGIMIDRDNRVLDRFFSFMKGKFGRRLYD
jgi:hypothetical protein